MADLRGPRLKEIFAGTAPYALRALWCAAGRRKDQRDKPPFSRMGGKAGLASPILAAWGYDRDDWSEVHLNELCPAMHAWHHVYADPVLRDQTARELAALIPCPACLPWGVQAALEGLWRPVPATCLEEVLRARGRADRSCPECRGTGLQDARRLWEQIRRTPVAVPQTLEAMARLLALIAFMQSRSFQLKPVTLEGGAWSDGGFKREWYGARDGTPDGHGFDSPRWTVAERIADLPCRWSCGQAGGMSYGAEFLTDRGQAQGRFRSPRWTL